MSVEEATSAEGRRVIADLQLALLDSTRKFFEVGDEWERTDWRNSFPESLAAADSSTAYVALELSSAELAPTWMRYKMPVLAVLLLSGVAFVVSGPLNPFGSPDDDAESVGAATSAVSPPVPSYTVEQLPPSGSSGRPRMRGVTGRRFTTLTESTPGDQLPTTAQLPTGQPAASGGSEVARNVSGLAVPVLGPSLGSERPAVAAAAAFIVE